MLLNSLDFAIMFIAFHLGGQAFFALAGRLFCVERKVKEDEMLAAGIVFYTVLAGYASLFMPVNTVLFLLLTIIALGVIAVCERERLLFWKDIIHAFRQLRQKKAAVILGILVILVLLSLSALMPSSYDDYLYHIQALRWTFEYPAVKGLANLHCRLGYNSTFFILQSLFAFPFVTGEAFHTLNAFLGAMLLVYCVFGFTPLRERKMRLSGSDLVRGTVVLYFLTNILSYAGLDTDPPAMMAVLYVVLKWTEFMEEKRDSAAASGLLVIFAAFACTVKLSVCPLLLLVVIPFMQLLRDRSYKLLGAFVGLGIFVTLPFFLRNYILTGYLLYPYPSIDLFRVSWKVPVDVARGDAEGIKLWGRSLEPLLYEGRTWQELLSMEYGEWMPIWFRKIAVTNRLMLLIDLAGIPAAVYCAVRLKKRGEKVFEEVFCYGTMHLMLLFWIMTAPVERYGSVYLFLPAAILFGRLLPKTCRVCGRERTEIAVVVSYGLILLLLIGMKVPASGAFRLVRAGVLEHPVTPASYEVKEMDEDRLISEASGEAFVIYTPKADDRADYVHFPAAQSREDLSKVRLRGADIRDGFEAKRTD